MTVSFAVDCVPARSISPLPLSLSSEKEGEPPSPVIRMLWDSLRQTKQGIHVVASPHPFVAQNTVAALMQAHVEQPLAASDIGRVLVAEERMHTKTQTWTSPWASVMPVLPHVSLKRLRGRHWRHQIWDAPPNTVEQAKEMVKLGICGQFVIITLDSGSVVEVIETLATLASPDLATIDWLDLVNVLRAVAVQTPSGHWESLVWDESLRDRLMNAPGRPVSPGAAFRAWLKRLLSPSLQVIAPPMPEPKHGSPQNQELRCQGRPEAMLLSEEEGWEWTRPLAQALQNRLHDWGRLVLVIGPEERPRQKALAAIIQALAALPAPPTFCPRPGFRSPCHAVVQDVSVYAWLQQIYFNRTWLDVLKDHTGLATIKPEFGRGLLWALPPTTEAAVQALNEQVELRGMAWMGLPGHTVQEAMHALLRPFDLAPDELRACQTLLSHVGVVVIHSSPGHWDVLGVSDRDAWTWIKEVWATPPCDLLPSFLALLKPLEECHHD